MGSTKSLVDLARFFAAHPLTEGAQLGAWLRFASWQLQSRVRREIVFSWISGQRLAVRRGMTGATGNIYVGLHEFTDMMFVVHLLRAGDLFFDIGANVGSYTVLSSGVCRAKTWAFEPDPDTAQLLARNVSINRLGCLVQVFECALGAATGEVSFTVGLDTMNKIADPNDTKVQRVHQERLDRLSTGAHPILLKIDVEGLEQDVLNGAQILLSRTCLKAIELETVTPESAGMLRKHHFERAYYDPFERRLGREPISLKSSNALFVRDWAFVEERLASASKIEILGRRI